MRGTRFPAVLVAALLTEGAGVDCASDIAGNPDGADDMVLFTLSRSFQAGVTMQGAQQ